MLALSPRQRLAPLCCAAGARRLHRRGGRARGSTREARSHIGAGAHRGNRSALCFPAVDPDRRALSAAGIERGAAAAADPGGLARPARSTGAAKAGIDAVRRRPLGRCELARSARSDRRARPRPAGIGADHVPAGIRGALDWPVARHQHSARPPGTRGGRDPGRACRRPAAAARGDGADRRQDRRGAALCRGTDQGGARGGLLVAGPQGWRLDGPLPPFAIPATLQDSLAARLDRLAPVKEIAQIGAAIGREFSYPVLRAVAGRDEPALRAALAQLEEAELLFRSGMPPDARYTFKHALVQDTAYETLLKSRRQS